MHPYLLSLCAEYVQLVDAMRHGRYSDTELRELDSQRQTTHNQLIDVTRLTPRDDMYRYAKAVLLAAQAEGHDR